MKVLLYLDNCCFNRPFDDQTQIQIRIETEAKLYIQERIKNGDFFLAWSYILDYENSANPFPEKKETIANWKAYAKVDIGESKSILLNANEFYANHIKAKDALHIACAVSLKCDYFITTDRSIIRKMNNFDRIKVISPIDFINNLNL